MIIELLRNRSLKLGINIDHIATIRQVRREEEPNVLSAAKEAIAGGADGITIHLREDRRHIQDHDVYEIIQSVPRVNLEMAVNEDILKIACDARPHSCCFVPEKREELTTEGGLNVIQSAEKLKPMIEKLTSLNIAVSLFIEPDLNQIKKTKEVGAGYIEIHTGKYANLTGDAQLKELENIKSATKFATELGLKVNAGHGLKYHNVVPIAQIPNMQELNIGHSIISRALFVGLKNAVMEMRQLLIC